MRALQTEDRLDQERFTGARVLVVDDEPAQVMQLEQLLQRAGYVHLQSVQDARQVLATCTEFQPDVILLDLQMPHLDGQPVIGQLQPLIAQDPFLPILILTDATDPRVRHEALTAGAKDFLTKPLDPADVLLRMRNLLETRLLHRETANQHALLEETVRLRTGALQSRDAILQAVSFATERFLKSGAFEPYVQEELARLGQATATSRVYIFENAHRPDGALGALPRYEWVTPGITPQIDNPEYRNFAYRADGFGRWEEVLSWGEPIHGPIREFPESEREALAAQQIRSIAVVPIFVNAKWWGLIGFDDCVVEREWSAAELGALRTCAGTFGAAIQRQRTEERLQRHLDRVAALHRIDLAISSSLDLRLTLDVFLDQVTRELRVDAASVLLFNRLTNTLEFAAGRGFRTRGIERTRLRLGEGVAGRAALERRILHVAKVAEAREFRRAAILQSEGFMSYYAAPLVAKGEVVGVLDVFHRAVLDPDAEWLDFLDTLAGQAAIGIDSSRLFADLQRSHAELMLAYDTTLEGWSKALDLRDKETEGHTLRVTDLTLRLAGAMGISEEEVVHMRRGALLHDIGKMGIPDGILQKPGPLTDEEWAVMRRHPEYAYELLSPIPYLRRALDIPYAHHEKWDGTGYPRGLKGEQIPLSARIFAVADVWDALTSDRPYRKAWPEQKVRAHVRQQSDTHFDPAVVAAFQGLEL